MIDLLGTTETARLLGVHPATLATWRVEGRGPRFVKVGERRVRYRREEIERWIEANTRQSTGEIRP